jgi:ribonuclease HI
MLKQIKYKPAISSFEILEQIRKNNRGLLRFDGGSEGNPGICSIGYVIYYVSSLLDNYDKDNKIGKKEKLKILEEGKVICQRNTNNYAEYKALIYGLKKAKELGLKRLDVEGDSNLIIKQMTGIYKVKSENIKDLYNKAKTIAKDFDNIRYRHIYRNYNSVADGLARKALREYKKEK